MQAQNTKLQDLIMGVKQFCIPLFQRPYTWGSHNDQKEWKVLWEDIMELYSQENPRLHFIGSIVTMPTTSVPEGVTKYLLIDGQQRLTTFFIILSILRDIYKKEENYNLSNEINETYLVNKFKKDNDYYKLLPTHKFGDRSAFFSLINNNNSIDPNNKIDKAYKFFERKIRQHQIDYQKLTTIITNYMTLVSIVLDPNDNPYLVFESLNAKGTPLSAADLIRNFFFMRIHSENQEEIFNKYWAPMEERLGDNLTEFIRHYLMRDGSVVNKNDIYFTLKDKVGADNSIQYLREMEIYSRYYEKLLNPDKEPDRPISTYLSRLNRIEVTTSYPMLLNFYHAYSQKIISNEDYFSILSSLENYLIRRFISGYPSRELNKIFPSLIKNIQNDFLDISDRFKELLSTKGYPKDYEFENRFVNMKFYGGADLITKSRLVLESIEDSFNHKEQVPYDKLSIEHIMPQTLTEDWKTQLGENWENDYELLLHSIGNLTLTGYNPVLSNEDFEYKCNVYKNSHLEMNKYFDDQTTWNKDSIERRAKVLFSICNNIWPYFGNDNITIETKDVTGKIPLTVTILGQKFEVKSWRDVLQKTLEIINDLEPEKINILVKEFPKYIGANKDIFREFRQLNDDIYFEVNLSASSIYKFCNQIMDTIELSNEDWIVELQ